MYLFTALKKYGKYIVIVYLILSATAYAFFHEHPDGRLALVWLMFILLAAAHLLDEFAQKHVWWYNNIYLRIAFSIVIATLLYVVFMGPFQIYVVRTSSMQPTIYPDNVVIVNRMAYRFKRPQRGDIALIRLGSTTVPMVHRIIACENDAVKISKNKITVNGQRPDFAAVDGFDSVDTVVPKGSYYHKGDNANSYYGVVRAERILGKIIYVAGGENK
jgi:signal peptidase I